MARGKLPFLFSIIACVHAIALAGQAHAQQSAAVHRISVIAPGFSFDSPEARAFRDGLRTAGYVEGRDLSIDWWFGEGRYDGVPDAVAKAVRGKVDVVVVESTVAALAAKRATQTIPIVMALVADPEGSGLVQSLGQPGGNITGVTNMTTQLMTKRLQLLTEAVPSARIVGVLWNPGTPPHKTSLSHLQSVAADLRVSLVPAPAQNAQQLEPAFSAFIRSKVGAVMVLDDAFMSANVPTIVRLATQAHVPVAYGWKALAKEGVFLSYATQSTELFQRAAGYVDKVLRGASPATLPVERPTRFELVINLRIAKALGLTIPESVILQADEVIR
jgi:putative ABC transport system substrate-binding protein